MPIKYNYRKEKILKKKLEILREIVQKTFFVMISNNFLDYWSGIIGPGPSILYMDLLSYCYGKKTWASFPGRVCIRIKILSLFLIWQI